MHPSPPEASAPTARRRLKADASRGRVLDAGARLFRERGYSGVRLVDIAEAAGLQKGSLYYHFGSREDILVDILNIGVDRVFRGVTRCLDALPATASHRDRILAATQEHLRLALEADDYIAANLRIYPYAPPDVRQRHAAARQRYSELWRILLTDAVNAGILRADFDLAVIRMFLLGSLTWSVEWYRPGARSIGEIAAQLTSILFEGAGVRC